MSDLLSLPRAGQYGCILADPPWHFQTWAGARKSGAGIACRASKPAYNTMIDADIAAMPVAEIAADNCVLFMWTCWPVLQRSFDIIEAWGFTYKTCAFSWMKADPLRLWHDEKSPRMGLGYWTRANTEPCLLATRGKPKRIAADVRQAIIAQPREHSRKPDGVHRDIERLVAGPYVELFARQTRPGWDSWGNEVGKFDAAPAIKQVAEDAARPAVPVALSSARVGEKNNGSIRFADDRGCKTDHGRRQ